MNYETDSEEDVNEELRTKYGYGLSDFESCLRNIKVYFDFTTLKKKKTQFRKKLKALESDKRKLIEHIDDFLSDTGLWDEIKQGRPARNSWGNERKVKFIERKFGLNHFFGKIDVIIRRYEKRIRLLDGFRKETEEKKKTTKRETLATLAWFYLMPKRRGTMASIFSDMRRLFRWFKANRPEIMEDVFGAAILSDNSMVKSFDASIIKARYDRYKNNPGSKQKVYRDLAFSIFMESIASVDEQVPDSQS